MRSLVLFPALVACAPGAPAPLDSAAATPSTSTPSTATPPTTSEEGGTVLTDTYTPPPTDTELPEGLYGAAPAVALAAPVFSGVSNRDGTPRTQVDLIGHPTVMWFYPAAASGG